MPFLDHLEELRWRVLYSLLAIVVATLVGWFIVERVDVLGMLIRPIAPLLPDGKLRFTSPTEPFFITLKFAFVLGVLLASPIIGYQIWAFLAPALYERERRMVMPALSVGVLLFLAGASAAYFWVLPRALQVLLSFQRGVLEPIITAGNYFGFAAQIIIAFGLMTELPLVVVILAALGLVTPQFLVRNRRYAIVVAAVAAALLSPPDAVSMVVMMVPLWLLYELSIGCAWIVVKRGARKARVSTGLVLLLLVGSGGAGSLAAQGVAPPRDTAARGPPGAGSPQGQRIDTATARKLGLPTGPTRTFPAPDAVMDSLLRLKGFRVTQYAADTLIVTGDSQTIFLRGQAILDRAGTKLEADSVRYRESTCKLAATGDPKLFEQGTVMVGESMGYDTCSAPRYGAPGVHGLPGGRRHVVHARRPGRGLGVHAPVWSVDRHYLRRPPRARLPFFHRGAQVDEQVGDGRPTGCAVRPRRPHPLASVHLPGRTVGPPQRHAHAAIRSERPGTANVGIRAAFRELGILPCDQRLPGPDGGGRLVRRPERDAARPDPLSLVGPIHRWQFQLHAGRRVRLTVEILADRLEPRPEL